MLVNQRLGALFALGMSLMTAGAATAQTLTFAADEWCPVNCAPGSEKPGYMVEIAEAILEPLGYQVDYQQITWARALLMTRKGQYDGVYAGTPEEATGFVFPSEPQGRYTIGLFVRKDDPWRYDEASSLKGKEVGLIIDYAYGDDIELQMERFAERRYAGGAKALEQNIRTLLAGHLDMIVEDVNSFAYKATELGIGDQFRLEKTFTEDNLYLALSPAKAHSHDIARALSNGMKRLRKSGELQSIMEKYGLQDWVQVHASEETVID